MHSEVHKGLSNECVFSDRTVYGPTAVCVRCRYYWLQGFMVPLKPVKAPRGAGSETFRAPVQPPGRQTAGPPACLHLPVYPSRPAGQTVTERAGAGRTKRTRRGFQLQHPATASVSGKEIKVNPVFVCLKRGLKSQRLIIHSCLFEWEDIKWLHSHEMTGWRTMWRNVCCSIKALPLSLNNIHKRVLIRLDIAEREISLVSAVGWWVGKVLSREATSGYKSSDCTALSNSR